MPENVFNLLNCQIHYDFLIALKKHWISKPYPKIPTLFSNHVWNTFAYDKTLLTLHILLNMFLEIDDGDSYSFNTLRNKQFQRGQINMGEPRNSAEWICYNCLQYVFYTLFLYHYCYFCILIFLSLNTYNYGHDVMNVRQIMKTQTLYITHNL